MAIATAALIVILFAPGDDAAPTIEAGSAPAVSAEIQRGTSTISPTTIPPATSTEASVTSTTTTVAAASVTTSTTTTTTAVPAAPTSTSAGAPTSPRSADVVAVVSRTCGASGQGDCFLALRSQPTGASTELGRLNEGTQVRVVCQVIGTRVLSSVLDAYSSVWTRTADGAFVANIFLDGPGLQPLSVTLPTC
jgi:hypothetical protein